MRLLENKIKNFIGNIKEGISSYYYKRKYGCIDVISNLSQEEFLPFCKASKEAAEQAGQELALNYGGPRSIKYNNIKK